MDKVKNEDAETNSSEGGQVDALVILKRDDALTRDIILRDICELLPTDPASDNAVCVSYSDLYRIVSEHLNLELDV